MKKLIALIIVLALAVGAFWYVKKYSPATSGTPVVASYSDGTTSVEASFDNTTETVTFTHPSVGTVTLPQAMSASGARYANEDETLVFWEHQDEVTITKDGVEVFKGMKAGATPMASGDMNMAPTDDTTTSSASLASTVWVWEKTSAASVADVVPTKADAFVLTFGADGRASATTDCNNISGPFTAGTDGTLSFGAFIATKKFCVNSQENVFTQALTSATKYEVSAEDKLVLTVAGGAAMTFKKQ